MGKKKGKKGPKESDEGAATASTSGQTSTQGTPKKEEQPTGQPPQKGKGPKQHKQQQDRPQVETPREPSFQEEEMPQEPPRWGPRAQRSPDQQKQQQQLPPQQQQRPPQQQRHPQHQQQQKPPQQQQRPPQQQQQQQPWQSQQQQQRPPQQQQQQRPTQQQQPWQSQQQQQQRPPQEQQQQRHPQQQQQQQQQGPPQQKQPWQSQQQQQQRSPQEQQQQRQSQQQQQQQRPPQQKQPWQSQQQQQQRPPQEQQQQRHPQQQQQQQQQRPPQQQRGGRGDQQQQRASQQQSKPQQQLGGGGDRASPRDLPQKMQALAITEPFEDRPLVKAVPGTVGRRIKIEVNHLKLFLGNLKSAIHYDVNIIPDLPKRCLRSVMEAFRQVYYPKNHPAFDGRKNLYSTKLLPFGESISGSVTIKIEDRDKEYKVEIKYANEVDLTPLQNLMRSVETPREALQVVDIVLRMAPASRCIPAGRSFFVKPANPIDLGEGMEMYNGFYQSAIRGWQPFLNVDVAHKAFPKSIPVTEALIDLLDSRFQQFGPRDLERGLDDRQRDTFQKFMRQIRVIYQIPNNPSSKRVFRVNGIKEPARTKTFKLDDGRSMTIEQYFATEKRYRLKYPLLPTLWVGALQREILIPLELCTIVEGQAVNRKMTENQTSAMIKHAATSTDVRKKKIYTAFDEAGHNNDPTVKEFGFSVANDFEQLDARVLPPPTLGYANNRTVSVSKGIWRGDRFLVAGKEIRKWTIAVADRRSPRPDELNNMANMIYRNAGQNGMTITSEATKPFTTMGSSPNDIRKYFQTAHGNGFDIIFVVVPNQGPQYSYVKKAAELSVGCLTQCVKMRTLGKMNQQTVGNILLKVNSKLNGTNHQLITRPPIMGRPIMIMGADVTHPSPDSQGIPSVAAVTASYDRQAFCYNICWRLQPPKMEIIEDLENITKEQLMYFYQKNRGMKPERIVFFRDGVSEGQFDQVKHAEIMAIRRACKQVQKEDYEPKITFLVVQKRHHTRMFPMNPRDSEDRNCNVPAGTCVDTTITHPFMQDFYLVSHASIQGVAKPTKYCTLWDDNAMTNDDIEQLTYFLCHMFTRCNRSVSYPAPTYYAHLAAARAKVYIENERLNMDDLARETDRYRILDVIRKDLPMFFV